MAVEEPEWVIPLRSARLLARPTAGGSANYKNWEGAGLVQLQWSKAFDGSWWLFHHVEPRQLESYGVFVVWRNGGGAKVSTVLYVGRGSLRDEFAKCRRDPVFRAERLFVTWAAVDDVHSLDAVAAYLYQQLRPMWGEVVPMVTPLPVNLPLSA